MLLVALLLMFILGGIQLRAALKGVEDDSVPVVERMRTSPLLEARPGMPQRRLLHKRRLRQSSPSLSLCHR